MMGRTQQSGAVTLIAIALLCTGYIHADDQCVINCPRSVPTNVLPKVGSTYVYSVESKTVLTPRDSVKVTLKADAEVSIESQCKSVLRLTNVVVDGVPDGADLATQLQVEPVQFGYFDGKVRSVCSVKGEEDWSLNIKRAIVSALQLSHTSAESTDKVEQDFSGKCTTTFSKLESNDKGTLFLKKKDLNKCSERRIDLRQTPDQALGQFKELIRHYIHPVDSDLSCKILLNKDNVVSSVDCDETHTLVYRASKPIHSSSLKLALKETKPAIATDFAAKEFETREIYFNTEHKHKHTSTEADVVVVLKKLCSEISGKTLQIEASTTFEDLVSKLRYLPDDAANSVDEAVKSGSICSEAPKRLRELFLDAAATSASDSSIKVWVKANSNGELSVSRSSVAFTVIALKASPSEDTVKALIPLISSEATTRPLLLGLSVLTRRYCQKSNDCSTNAGVKEARDALSARLAKTTDPLNKITLIKALDNLSINKENNENVIKTLDEIINNPTSEVGAQVAAVQALPDDPSLNDQLNSIALKETNENEVRIAALRKLTANNGLKDASSYLNVQEHCIKNYVLGYFKNLQKSKNAARRAQLPEGVTLSEEPSKKLGITKNLAVEYGPAVFEVDVIYPKNSNVTSAITLRASRAKDDKVVNVVEISLRQQGLDKNVGNVLNVLQRKISPAEFGVTTVKHIAELIGNLRKADHTHNHLQWSVRLNGKNVIFSDAFNDLHTTIDLVKARIKKLVDEKSVDRTIGGVLIDTKVVVPTITGIPLVYKLDDNFVWQANGKYSSEGKKRKIVVNHSFNVGVLGSIKLKLKENKIGYEYNANLLFSPHFDVDTERQDKSVLIRLNTPEERSTIVKFAQSLKEVKSGAAQANEIENELAPEPRSENCIQPLILNHCHKITQVKGLIFPNFELYVTKPDKAITALEVELSGESPAPDSRRYSAKVKGVGSSTDTEHFAQIEVAYPKGAPKEVKITLKSPTNKLESKFSLNLDGNRNLEVKINLPHVVELDVKGKSLVNKETNTYDNEFNVDYKFPSDPTVHNINYKLNVGFNLKRSSKDKVANLDVSAELKSSRVPLVNHATTIRFKYRPLKQSEILLQLKYGSDLSRVLKFSRVSTMEVKEMKPFTVNGQNDVQIVVSALDVNYDLKTDFNWVSDKGLPSLLEYNVKGKDLSKRSVSSGVSNDIDGQLKYTNKLPDIDQTIAAKLKANGKEYAYNSEMKQVAPQKYESKITVQNGSPDKKIFVVAKFEASRPTKDITLVGEAEATFSDKPDKLNYNVELRKTGPEIIAKAGKKKDGVSLVSHDLKFTTSTGELSWKMVRPVIGHDLKVDNILRPKVASLVFNVRDRVYNLKLDRVPLRHSTITLEGNDKALVKSGKLHLSLADPITLELVTKANTDVKVFIDVLSSERKITANVKSPKYDLTFDHELVLSLQRILAKYDVKRGANQVVLNADIARKGSLITLTRVSDGKTYTVKYSRQSDKVELDIDGEYIKGRVEGTPKSGKINLKNADGSFEVQSTYKFENHKLVIESTSSNNGKLEALWSYKEPSKFIFESPKVKTHVYLDPTKPRKTFSMDLDTPQIEKTIQAEYERGLKVKYLSATKLKSSNKSMKIDIDVVPHKELKAEFDSELFKFKAERPPSGDKIKFSYTLNDYTDTEEYDFDTHKSLVFSWASVLRQYVKSFIVE